LVHIRFALVDDDAFGVSADTLSDDVVAVVVGAVCVGRVIAVGYKILLFQGAY
jgi:hypothetical protein